MATHLVPQDEALFRAFQSNLLSLISHELRTPLTGILNALTVLKDSPEPMPGMRSPADQSWSTEMLSMAWRNAQRLHQVLADLLDLAALESGTFHARLREVDFATLVGVRLQAQKIWLKEQGLSLQVEEVGHRGPGHEAAPILADPQKLARAIDLCLQIAAAKADREKPVKLRISSTGMTLQFSVRPSAREQWESSWTQAQVGAESGLLSPMSAFVGTLQSQEAFLSRMEEGLGSEFLLLQEILRIHQGRFEGGKPGVLRLELPEMSSEEGLEAVLTSRTEQAAVGLSSVSVALIRIPPGQDLAVFRRALKDTLFRSSDAVYSLPKLGAVAVVLDDCRAEDARKIVERMVQKFRAALRFGTATCPTDSCEAAELIALAQKRLDSQA